MGKNPEGSVEAAPLCLFWSLWEDGNSTSFKNQGQFNQALKMLFSYAPLLFTEKSMDASSISILDLVD